MNTICTRSEVKPYGYRPPGGVFSKQIFTVLTKCVAALQMVYYSVPPNGPTHTLYGRSPPVEGVKSETIRLAP